MIIAEIEKNTKERIRVSLEEYKGHRFIDCRVYFEDAAGEWRPTKKGLALNEDCIDEVIDTLKQASDALEDLLSPRSTDRKPRPGTEKTSPGAGAGAPKADTRNISERVRTWVSSVNDSQFSVKDCRRGLSLTEAKQAHLVNVVFSKLCDEGVIERTGEGRGSYRRLASSS
jgi:hypothetical protein